MGNLKQDWSQYPVTAFLIDDQQSVTKSIQKLLKHVEHINLYTCNDPTHAINEILSIGPTVLLLDIHMPVMDGFAILEQLQQNEAIKDIPTIVLTVDTSIETKKKAFMLGANDYLIKTPDKTELSLRLRYHTRAYVDHLERESTLRALRKKKDEFKVLIQKLELSSYQDSLTLVANRRGFDEAFAREWHRAMRETTPLSLIFIDLDYFKQYNDFYGHLAGDDCLKEVAQTLQGISQRPTDFFARYGGEEFVLLLPNTDAIGALHIAEKLRIKAVSLNLEHQASKVCDYVTISLGVATTIPMIKHQPRDFIYTADQALYSAKKQGRNQVVCKGI